MEDGSPNEFRAQATLSCRVHTFLLWNRHRNFHEHCFSSWTLLNCDTLVVAALYLHPLIENPMTFENILFETKNSIAYVTVNRPKALNALNMATMEDLYAAFTDIQDDSSIRTAILTGAGEKAFVAGADITE